MKRASSAIIVLTLLAAALALWLHAPNRVKPATLVDRTVAAHPNALWHIVHDLCVPDMEARGRPAPCVIVDLNHRYVVLKDIEGATQFLLLPTDQVPGIESPALLAPSAPNYWQAAWAARTLFEQKVGHPVPREDIALAVNSQYGRTQNQLHIHIDCVGAKVHTALAQHEDDITTQWSSLALGSYGRTYRVRWIDGPDLNANPFKILFETDPVAHNDMARETLVVVGAQRRDGAAGFVLISDRAMPDTDDDPGAGEELMNHKCTVLAAPAPSS